jgi:hypothetical protein
MLAKFQEAAHSDTSPAIPDAASPPPSPDERAKDPAQAASEAFAKLPPMERWKIRIERAKLSEIAANEIIDALLDPGYHTETITRMTGRLTVTLRTRDGAHRDRLRLALDQLQNPTQITQQETMQRLNLTDSIVQLNLRTRTLTFEYPRRGDNIAEVEKLYQARRTQLDEIGENVLDVLYQLLGEFDNRVMAATSEGAVEGF